jgi:hypothetical protein
MSAAKPAALAVLADEDAVAEPKANQQAQTSRPAAKWRYFTLGAGIMTLVSPIPRHPAYCHFAVIW